ncbi:signal recognition particle-docking protein FtsY [Endozoicomonas sp. SESOKO2]|uniref:signal recognition particle-docking protein FtsY n=1 Tax=Endozoicomonas sp. SESOKO2 TaxID=2828743 RepID=UPI00214936A8|nr:signal recognition particle-docking protein FtsY [Endozoicomonas sp. SESOKO2]
MFGSRKSDEKTAKRRFWPWGRKEEKNSEPVPVIDESPKTEPTAAHQETVVQTEVEGAVAETAEETVSVEPVEIQAEKVEEKTEEAVKEPKAETVATLPSVPERGEPQEEKKGFFARMKRGLGKTRSVFVDGVAEIFVGKKEIDEDLLEELETQLLISDVGVEATTEIIGKLTKKVKYRELGDADALISAMKVELKEILKPADQPLIVDEQKTPYVILVVGVNGVGKTTTIGKVARKLQAEGRKVMLAAGDTFRAAAVEQLQVWGERNDIPVIAQHTGADSASVLYDAFEAAKARGADVLIADTAGRLHNKDNLMDELRKVKRVLGKLDDSAPHEVLLVLDAGTGQNALNQARIFHEAVNLTGMALTKLDGTAKGGVVFALSKQMQLPIRFLGVGEQIDDLRPFSADEFVEALFDPVEP